jgi:hypothetical protein
MNPDGASLCLFIAIPKRFKFASDGRASDPAACTLNTRYVMIPPGHSCNVNLRAVRPTTLERSIEKSEMT